MEINGMAHVILTVSDFEASLPFYKKLLPYLGMKPVIDSREMFYCVGGRTALGIMPAEEKYRGEKSAREFGAKIVHPPEAGSWAPGYYSVLFEDADGIRLEVNFVPGKGLLAEQ